MKQIFIVGLILALSGAALGLKDPICGQKPWVVGNCTAYIYHYSYNPEKNECEGFYHGGCKTNDNLFREKADCEAKCKE